jgi:S-adenosylmethionine uptake transporter
VLFCAGAFALPMVLCQVLVAAGPRSLRPALPGLMALRSGIALLNGVLGAYAFATLPLAEAYAVFFTMPILIALLGVPILGERMDGVRAAAILVGLAGVIVALRPGQVPLEIGHAAALGGAFLGALNYVVLRRTGAVERPAVQLFWPMAVQLLSVALAMPFVWQPMPVHDLALCLLMAVELVVGGMLIVWAYRTAPVITVAPMQYSQIAWAVVLGAIWFGEVPDGPTLLGIAVIVIAGLVILLHRPFAENRG